MFRARPIRNPRRPARRCKPADRLSIAPAGRQLGAPPIPPHRDPGDFVTPGRERPPVIPSKDAADASLRPPDTFPISPIFRSPPSAGGAAPAGRVSPSSCCCSARRCRRRMPPPCARPPTRSSRRATSMAPSRITSARSAPCRPARIPPMPPISCWNSPGLSTPKRTTPALRRAPARERPGGAGARRRGRCHACGRRLSRRQPLV
jgi:hypothetical protein